MGKLASFGGQQILGVMNVKTERERRACIQIGSRQTRQCPLSHSRWYIGHMEGPRLVCHLLA